MLETELLELFDAENDSRSFNRTNGNGKFGNTGRKFSDEHRAKLSASHKVSMNKESVKNAISAKLTGVKTNRVPKTAFKQGNIPWNKISKEGI
jgi:hypothetical protein